MSKLIILIALILFYINLIAQFKTDIDSTILITLEKSCIADAQLIAAQNALSQVDGNKISQNWGKIISVDPYFSLRLKDKKITDQKNTGRCWLFSALNIIRPFISKKLGCDDIELSQNYLYFFEKLEKSNLFLNSIIQTREKPYTDRFVENLFKMNVQDGQNWLGFMGIVKKYGVVPKNVMPETYSSSNSNHVNKVLSTKLKQAAIKIRHEKNETVIQDIKMETLKDIFRILVINFGLPPKEFTWRYEMIDKKLSFSKTYTPRQFFDEFVVDKLEEFYPIYSIPTLAFNKKYEIDLNRIVSSEQNMYFVNCPLETMKEIAVKSLLDSNAVWFGCDVEQQSNFESGLMTSNLYDFESLYGMDFKMSREGLFESYSCSPTHNMVFTGIDILDGKVKKWLVENSWGVSKGKEGYLYMLDDWFNQFVQVIVVNKKYIPKELLEIYNTKASMLPPWDPMLNML
ncbi:MAG: C1 family peptidase [Bacteroidota bacterium]